ncbi:MAG: NAD(P)-binding protein [Pirellulaceae bacterium]|nr:NAD(P)-binding protein [Pirellulaceae bacterium]
MTISLDNLLPVHLLERSRNLKAPSQVAGQFVLYWMQTAMRTDENPALDVACHLANELQLPLLVYQGVSERYEYASDRHHTFILEGAADVARQCQAKGIAYALHIEQRANQPTGFKPLRDLMARAAWLVVEDMPTDPHRKFVRAAVLSSRCPIVAVDTACVVPMQLTGQAFDRAFAYRDHTRALYKQRIGRSWPVIDRLPVPVDLNTLAWTSVDLRSRPIADWVADCEIDHTLGPIEDTRGGSMAGYARWSAFERVKLRRYAKDRNDPLKAGSSRMSAYLHYGMVSPLRIAREAFEQKSEGAEKYLDELLIWRELAYSFCFFRPDHARWSALPAWAQQTLAVHRADKREQIYGWEELARGQTHDALWNAAQKSLLIYGELHNNLRMTWGKALLGWCEDPRECLRLLLDLNHRYALDGRDQASYGGLLWCLGQFDRPFTPEEPIYGTVRTRPTAEHAQRLNVEEYSRRTSGSPLWQPPKIAVIGAGLAGSFAARCLHDRGYTVTVFEKSRGASGRLSTRHDTHADFDHGAQYFTCRDPRFRRYVSSWIQSGLVAPWPGKVAIYENGHHKGVSEVERFVGVPGMNVLGKHLLQSVDVRYGIQVARLVRNGRAWSVLDENQAELGKYDQVILAIPAPQAAELVAPAAVSEGVVTEGLVTEGILAEGGMADDQQFVAQLRVRQFHPAWAVMATLSSPITDQWCGAFINSGPVRWVSRNNTKPGRAIEPEALVLHATADWTREHLADDKAIVAEQLLSALWRELAVTQPPVLLSWTAHRWLYAMPMDDSPVSKRVVTNLDRSLVACGDWASGSRVEGAFLSGAAAAGLGLRAEKE